MATGLPGFTVKNNLGEISAGNLAISNLISGSSKPFNFQALDIFRSNFKTTATLSFIPNNTILTIPLDPTFVLDTPDLQIDVGSNVNLSPGVTTNLGITNSDLLITEPTGPENATGTQQINSITRSRLADTASIILSGVANLSRELADPNRTIKIQKQNNASYSPVTGKFTFGKDINFVFTNGDQITSVDIKNFSPVTPIDSPKDGVSIYPLVIFDSQYDTDNKQHSFRLKRSTAVSDTPILFNSRELTSDSPDSPAKLTFDPRSIINFTRTNPVSQANLLSIVPPVLKFGEIEDLDEIEANKTGTFGDITILFNGMDTNATISYGYQSSNASDDSEEPSSSDYTRFKQRLDDINNDIDLSRTIIATKLDKRKNYVNSTSNEFIVNGPIVIQDPDVLNSPKGVLGFLNSPAGLVPAPYIKESDTFTRAFSTFDGPWTTVLDTKNSPRSGLIAKGAPGDDDYVQDLVVNELVFRNSFNIERFSSPTNILDADDIAVGDSPVTNFDFKMPIKVEETDPITGEINEVDYFLLLKSE